MAGRAPLTGTTATDRPGLELSAGTVRLRVSAEAGGRISSLVVDDRELLVTSGIDAIHWGSYPMAPFAGRVRDGRFAFRGRQYELPRTMPPHAIHGVVFDRPWDVVDACTLAIELADPWPFAGRVVQRFALEPDGLDVTMELSADEPMPAALGWHPWFRRRLGGPDAAPVELRLDATHMLPRDPDGIAGRELVEPTPGPWDDCFTDLRQPPRLVWPGVLALEITSSGDYWVVFNEQPDAVCVEPQTEPPNELNHRPHVIEPGDPLVAEMHWRWWRPEARG